MKFFNKNYFTKGYDVEKTNTLGGRCAEFLRGFQEIISKKYSLFHSSLHIILNLPKNAKVLDVGCGIGNWFRLIHKYRPDIKLYGADIGDVEDFLPNYVDFTKCSGDNLPYEDNFFDYVTNMHVLEHVLNPQDFVNEFYRVLRKGACCYIETPSLRNIFFPGDSNFYHDPSHIKPFVPKGLRRLGITIGFLTIKSKYVRNYPFTGFLLIILSPVMFFMNISGFDRGGFGNFMSFLFGGAVYYIGKK